MRPLSEWPFRFGVRFGLQILRMSGHRIFNLDSRSRLLFQAAALVFTLALLNSIVMAQRAATRQAPKNAEQFYAQGVALLRKGDPVRAAASFRSALRMKPDFAEAHNALGLALGGQGQIDAA